MKVLVPTAETMLSQGEMARRPADLVGKVIGLLWNSKPNGDMLLRHLGRTLENVLRPSEILMKHKSPSTSMAPVELIEELSRKCSFVILAIGD